MFKCASTDRVLIANRGEIACRIASTLKRLKIPAVGIYTWPEKNALHTKYIDETHLLPGAEPVASYLNIENIVAVAKATSCTAVHPGYGFLSENPEFADALSSANIEFIGPSAECMRQLGNKVAAKNLAQILSIPFAASDTLGTKLADKISTAGRFAASNGFPFLIKAAAGGGGRGMRVVRAESEIAAAVEQAEREAILTFNDGQLFCEQLIESARHVEVQFLADRFKNVFIFFDRDCSSQRNHQKIIEEAPAPGLSNETRLKLYDYTKKLALACNYHCAGTAEFLVDQSQNIYFLEVNSRLQVEHPVSELISGYDLVELQLKAAAGENLSNFVNLPTLPPDNRHAIELRLCAELPQKNYLPTTGIVSNFQIAKDQDLRIDSSIATGVSVLPYFDSLLAKIICVAESRTAAISKLKQQLGKINTVGVENNSAFLAFILNSAAFLTTKLHTGYLKELKFEHTYPTLVQIASGLAAFGHICNYSCISSTLSYRTGGLRCVAKRLHHQGQVHNLQILTEANNCFIITDEHGKEIINLQLKQINEKQITYHDNLQPQVNKVMTLVESDRKLWLSSELGGFCFDLCDPLAAQRNLSHALNDKLYADLPGKILKLTVEPGSKVTQGQEIVIMESMKMEHCMYAPANGILRALHVGLGQQVDTQQLVAEFTFDE